MKHLGILLLMLEVTFLMAEEEKVVPMVDSGEGTRCDKDIANAQTCFQCTRLPNDIAVKLTDCCMEDEAFDFCKQCVEKPAECFLQVVGSITSGEDSASEENGVNGAFPDQEEEPEIEKRYGRLFLGKGRRRGKYPYWKRLKRWGTFFLGKGNSRYRYFGKRGYEDDDEEDSYDDLQKRFGRLFLSHGRQSGKRFGSLFLGKYGRRY